MYIRSVQQIIHEILEVIWWADGRVGACQDPPQQGLTPQLRGRKLLLGDSLPLLSVGHTLSVIRDPFQNSLEEHLVGMSVLWDWMGRRDVGGYGSHRRNRLALRIMKHLARNPRAGAPNRLSGSTPYFSSGVHHDTSGPGSFHLLRIHLGLLVGDRVSQYFSCQSDR